MSKWVDANGPASFETRGFTALLRMRGEFGFPAFFRPHPEERQVGGANPAASRRTRAALAIIAFSIGFATLANAQQKPPPLGIGREATQHEIAGWDIDVRPDGQGLPHGKGTVKQGEEIYVNQCSACHGEFGESAGRWPILSGGAGTLKSHDPVKSVGSYWPYASTLFDYIRRAMPYGNAQSLSNDELYAVTAYVLYLNDIIRDEDFELSEKTFKTIKLPNQAFHDDDRETTEKHFWQKTPCMKDCTPGAVKVTGRARVLDVTPEAGKGPKVD